MVERKIELLHRSSKRMIRARDNLPCNRLFWAFLRRESWLHLRLSVRLIFAVLIRRKTRERLDEKGGKGA